MGTRGTILLIVAACVGFGYHGTETPRRSGQYDKDSVAKLIRTIEKKIAVAEKLVKIEEEHLARAKPLTESGRLERNELAETHLGLFDARIRLLDSKQQLLALRAQYDGNVKALREIPKLITEKIARAEESAAVFKGLSANAKSLMEAGRAPDTVVTQARARVFRSELKILDFKHELHAFHARHPGIER